MPRLNFVIYTSYRCANMVYIKGRLLRGRLWASKKGDGYLVSIIKTALRLLSRELKNHPIEIQYGTSNYKIASDHEGYFELIKEVDDIAETVKDILFTTVYNKIKFTSRSYLKIYNGHSVRGVITDIDDTILVTGVKSLFKNRLLLNSIFLNPFRRKAISSAADYIRYRKETNGAQSPVIYISNSPWNMYDYLRTFLNLNKFPEGELLLRDFGFHLLKKKKTLESRNKYKEMLNILKTFPQTRFALIGDSAERDFDIYQQIKKLYPPQVEEIIIIKAGNLSNETYIAEAIKKDDNSSLVESFTELFPENRDI